MVGSKIVTFGPEIRRHRVYQTERANREQTTKKKTAGSMIGESETAVPKVKEGPESFELPVTRGSMAPEVGFEPTTNRLTADRSTTELLRSVVGKDTSRDTGRFKKKVPHSIPVQSQPGSQPSHLALRQTFALFDRLFYPAQNQILQHFCVFRVDDFLCDLDRDDSPRPFATTVTFSPPTLTDTVFSASASFNCSCIFAACFIIFWMFIV